MQPAASPSSAISPRSPTNAGLVDGGRPASTPRARSCTRSKGAKLMLIVETIGRIQREPFVLEPRSDHSPERAAFGLRRPKGNGSDDNLLQKIRNWVKLAP